MVLEVSPSLPSNSEVAVSKGRYGTAMVAWYRKLLIGRGNYDRSDYTREESGGQMELSRGEKAKEGAKTASYSLVILAGLGMCGTVFYTVFRLELYSPCFSLFHLLLLSGNFFLQTLQTLCMTKLWLIALHMKSWQICLESR